jgi:hypothetical protein
MGTHTISASGDGAKMRAINTKPETSRHEKAVLQGPVRAGAVRHRLRRAAGYFEPKLGWT